MYADYYLTHPQEKAKDVTVFDFNINTLQDKLNVLKKNPYKFIGEKTENIMDYDLLNEVSFFKWQWKVMESEAKQYYH